MRGMLQAVGLFVALAALGCAQDKYHLTPKYDEEYNEVPNEKLSNEPDTATYRKPPAPKKEDTLVGQPGGINGPGGGLGGF